MLVPYAGVERVIAAQALDVRTQLLQLMPCQGGLYAMDSSSTDMESGVESELVDLSAVSMTVLRKLDDTALRRALRHVMQQTVHPRVSSGNGTREQID